MTAQQEYTKVCENCKQPYVYRGSPVEAMSRRFCGNTCRLAERKRFGSWWFRRKQEQSQ